MHRKQFIVGSSGKGSLSYSESAALRDLFGAPLKIVSGLSGQRGSAVAISKSWENS